MVNLAIFGAGIMGANHGRVARSMPQYTVTAICDPDLARAEAVAGPLQAVATTDFDEAIRDAEAVVLAAPSDMHGELGERILKSGRDLLVEKPIATTVADAERLVEAAAANDRILMVGHVERFNPAVVELRQLVDEPLSLEITRVGPFSSRNLADVVLDLMIHDVDLAMAIVGQNVVQQEAMARVVRSGDQDLACALLRFENGVIANITASRVSQNKIRRITLTQRENSVVADLLRQHVEVHRIEHSEYLDDGGVRYRQSGRVEIPFLSQHGEPLMHELSHFAECVTQRTDPLVSGADGLAALRICLDIRDSAVVG
ncbi:Gfo/Idh/MocA family protein [Rugosimonospora africana]|uniref:Oxidoreductase n=1 Tax=Rugosimonospora africana TaxID=556532 RepID=A0A8J3QPF1_9ACTN|nr:Gfo/Idh/MocA family oxidoreductase [Rugosimonospora africana]GIH13969.1 oxidoreductase [Rugosimonospora africana]